MSCIQAALRAKEAGSTRFCMGAAWRGPTQVHAPCHEPTYAFAATHTGTDEQIVGITASSCTLVPAFAEYKRVCKF